MSRRPSPPKPPKAVVAPKPVAVGSVRIRAVGSMGSRQRGTDTLWYFRAERYSGGGSTKVWSGWATVIEATREVARLVGGLAPTARSQAAPTTIADLLENWVGHREDLQVRGAIAPDTYRTQRYCAEHLVGGLGPVLVDRLDRNAIERYRDTRLRGGAAPNTVRIEIIALRTAWRWGREVGLVDGELASVRLPTGHTRPRNTPTRGDVVAVLAQLDGWRRVIVELYASTGCRLGELAYLHRRDVDLERCELAVEGKTGKRVVPLSPPTVALLAEWMAESPGAGADAPLWGVAAKTVRAKMSPTLAAACAAAGVRAFSPHGLRRMVVGALYRSNAVDIGTAASLVGHSPATALKHYRDVTEGDRRAAVQLARLGYLDDTDVVDLATRRKG